MSRLDSARRLLAVLDRRGEALRRQVERGRRALSEFDARIAERRASIARLGERLAAGVPPTTYAHCELMRVRGKQATLRFDITCQQVEIDTLIEQRQTADQALRADLGAARALERRRGKHRDWLAAREKARERRRDAIDEADVMEGGSHGSNHPH
ncbi:BsaT protein [Burkholderia alba]|uniref:BsaT protein n=1 Tax=Burkholderia alba TaxID=2683677 RepID=UPI002B05E676|nr:BsaT protein [Burkholderia alba]